MTPREKLSFHSPDARTLKPGDEEFRVIEALMRPLMEAEGTSDYCRADLWRSHPSVQKALQTGEPLVIFWPGETWTLSEALIEAIRDLVSGLRA